MSAAQRGPSRARRGVNSFREMLAARGSDGEKMSIEAVRLMGEVDMPVILRLSQPIDQDGSVSAWFTRRWRLQLEEIC